MPLKFADASQFHPNKLSVNNIFENDLMGEGKHEERDNESGAIQRHFICKYEIPSNLQMDTIESNLSDQGVLSKHRESTIKQCTSSANSIKCSSPSNDNQKSDIQQIKQNNFVVLYNCIICIVFI